MKNNAPHSSARQNRCRRTRLQSSAIAPLAEFDSRIQLWQDSGLDSAAPLFAGLPKREPRLLIQPGFTSFRASADATKPVSSLSSAFGDDVVRFAF
jgi:hypothetical protein